MVVTRSPFVKKQTIDYGYGTDENGNTTYTDSTGKTTIVSNNSGSDNDKDKKVKLTNTKLDGTLAKTVRTINSSNLSEGDKTGALRDALALRERGAGPQFSHGGIYNNTIGLVKEGIKQDINYAIAGYNNYVTPVIRGVQSLGTELIDGVRQIFDPNTTARASYADWDRQARIDRYNTFGSNSVYNIDDSTKLGKYGGPIVRFISDTLADPTTYLTLGGSAANSSTRIALATRMQLLVPKYPELAPLIPNIARYGAAEIPKNIAVAENIFSGVKYMGVEIPATSGLSKAWRYTLGAARANVGDAVASTNRGAKAIELLTKKSNRPLVVAGFTRRAAMNTVAKEFVGGMQMLSSDIAHRAAQKTSAATMLAESRQFVTELDELAKTDKTFVDFYKVVENPSGPYVVSQPVRDAAAKYRLWDDAQRDSVNTAKTAYGNKWGVLVRAMGFVDDHMYHSLSDDARKYLRSDAARDSKYFVNYEISESELRDPQGIASFRKYRKPSYDANNNIIPETQSKFLGVDIERGTIEEMNEISQRVLKINWFKTEPQQILLDSISSYSRMYGRIAHVNRAMEFGPEVIKPLIKHVVQDEDLVKRLLASHKVMQAIQTRLENRIASKWRSAATREGLAQGLTDVSDLAINTLAGNLGKKVAVDEEVKLMQESITQLLSMLEEARVASLAKTTQQRGEFTDIWAAMINEAEEMSAALAAGNGDRFIALKELRAEYLLTHGDAADDVTGRSAEWFAERIVRRAGGADVVTAEESKRVARKELMQEQLDALPLDSSFNQERQVLRDLIEEIDVENEGFRRLSSVKTAASYSDTGLIYGFVPINTGEPEPFQLFTTSPIEDEFGVYSQMDDAIAGHAIPEEELLDLRDPEKFLNMLNPEFWAEDINKAWNQVGIIDATLESEVVNMVRNNGVLDPDYIRVNPEKAEWLSGMWDYSTDVLRRFEDGKLDEVSHGEIQQFFNWFQDMQGRIMHSYAGENSDVVGRTVSQWWMKNLVDGAEEYGYKGALVPLSNILEQGERVSAEWAVLMPSDMPTPKVGMTPDSPWQMVKGNAIVDSALNNGLESYQLALLSERDALIKSIPNVGGPNLVERAAKTAELAALEKESIAARALQLIRNNDEVLVKGVAVPRKQVLDKIAAVEEKIASAYKDIDRQVANEIEATFGVGELDTLRLSYEERLPMLMNQAKVLQNWNDNYANGLIQEVQDMMLLLANKPAKGSTGASNAAWSKHVMSTLTSSEMIDDPAAREAYLRITTMLHADEVALAKVTSDINQNLFMANMAQMGIIGKVVNKMADDGWTEIAGMGVQMPKEVLDRWRPNLRKLNDRKEANGFVKALDATTNYWKKYVTASVGFVARNGLSGTFMNYADGVTNADIIKGLKWAAHFNDTKRGMAAGKGFDNWMARAKINTPEEMAKAEYVVNVLAASGHGVNDDFAAPTVGRLKQVTDNRYLKFFQRKNTFIETALRMPMALDSYARGQSLDEAVARVGRVHFDYSDLSTVDANMKRIVPFWIWTSRNIPLQLTQMATNPKAYYEYERLQDANPVNADLILPKWIQDKSPLGFGLSGVLTPDLPHLQLLQKINSVTSVEGLAGQASPFIKLPTEVLFANRSLGIDVGDFRQEKVTNGYMPFLAKLIASLNGTKYIDYDADGNIMLDSKINYIIETILPQLAQINRLTGGFTGGKDTLEERQLSSILNWLGIPYRGVGPEQENAELVRRDYGMQDFRQLIKDRDTLNAKKKRKLK